MRILRSGGRLPHGAPVAPDDRGPSRARLGQFATRARTPLRRALEACGEYGPEQTAGRFYPMACAALEVTQRCNLDCTLCYLSEAAEAAHDPPLEILIGRVRDLAARYGPGVSVQLSGGDPTLRSAEDLEALCREIRSRGLRSCLMTNGVKATRALLRRLAAAGLDDVAFHVDLTQERRGHPTEVSLHSLRDAYLARARGLGLRVLFNTTIYDGNLAELPALAAYFRDRAGEVTLASFQLQADAGRGVIGAREGALSVEAVAHGISQGLGAHVDFDAAAVGHSACNRYGAVLVAGDRVVSILRDHALVRRAAAALEAHEAPSDAHLAVAATLGRIAIRRPGLALALAWEAASLLWRVRGGWWRTARAGGRPAAKLSFLIHNFMDSGALDPERCAACVFMVATEEGPVSMCVHNAERDRHVFAPARLPEALGSDATGAEGPPLWWSAATGEVTAAPDHAAPAPIAAKRRKGRAKRDGGSAPHSTKGGVRDQGQSHPRSS